MPLMDFGDRHIVKLLATETRRTDTTPKDLAESHEQLGFFLAGELAEHLDLAPKEILHPQGKRTGWQLADEAGVALVVFMRAGLYVAEGMRRVLKSAPVHHTSPRRGVGLDDEALRGVLEGQPHTIILVDSVVNTGASLEPVLAQFEGKRLFVASLVTPKPTAERLAAAWPDVCFLFARVSDNQYVGRGGTDTGNRLFGTLGTASGATP
jgi:uracil phosphoribosyltransferase